MDLLTYYSDLAVAYPEYITQKQFCEVCGICHKTAYNLTRRGEISYEIVDTPTGRIHHIKLTDALAYLYKKDTLYGNDENVNRQIYEVLQAHFSYLPDLLRTQQIRELTGFSMTAIQRWVLEKRIMFVLACTMRQRTGDERFYPPARQAAGRFAALQKQMGGHTDIYAVDNHSCVINAAMEELAKPERSVEQKTVKKNTPER